MTPDDDRHASVDVSAEADVTGVLDAIQSAIARLERAPPEEVAETQLRALERMIRHARSATDFHAGRLASLFKDEQFTPQNWGAVPILTREDVRLHGPALRSRTLPEGTLAREGTTSGSSGTPLDLSWSTLGSISTRAVVERLIAWHELDPTLALAEIRSFPPELAAFPGLRMKRGWSFRGPAAPYHRLSVTTSMDDQIGWLGHLRAPYLMTYPTMARELAQRSMDTGVKLQFDAILTVGEVLTDEIREICRAAFGARVIDSYGCQEMGKIAIECEVSGDYHVCTSNILLEVLDDSGRQVRQGEVGRIVLTGLYNYAMPFVRYDIGDFGRLGPPCACGRSLPVLTEILGRRRNMLSLPGGDRRWLPGRALTAMASHLPTKKIRLVQVSLDDFELLYEPAERSSEPNLAGLAACARQHIHPDARIRAIAVDSLPRSPGGKYEDVVGLD